MRKTILKITLGGAIAIMAAIGVQMASSNKTVSNLIMQNAEALASGEGSSSGHTLTCSGLGYCHAKCGRCGTELTGTGKNNVTISKCPYN